MSLTTLPTELQDQILHSLPLCSDLHSLSLVSHSLHALVSSHGWSVFAQTRFPLRREHESIRTLATAARNLERRGMRAFRVGPVPLTTGRQSMGYMAWVATDGEMVGVGAGTEVCTRPVTGGEWERFAPEGAREGRDDVTALVMGEGRTIYGTAAGNVASLDGKSWDVQEKRVVNLALRDEGDMFTALTSDGALSLFHMDGDATEATKAISETALHGAASYTSTRAWQAAWLNDNSIAASLSRAKEPICLYTVRPTGLSANPTQRVAIHPTKLGGIHPITPLHGSGGSVFASGGNDGVVRIHDVRSPEHAVQYTAMDVAEYGPVYSLLSRPGHHLLAGTAQFDLLSVLDLRNRHFQRLPLESAIGEGPSASVLTPDAIQETHQKGVGLSKGDSYDWHSSKVSEGSSASYNLFLREKNARHQGPVYSLASPSPYSPYIFAGLEHDVVQICLDGAADRNPDPDVRKTVERLPKERRDEPARQRRNGDHTSSSATEVRLKSVEQATMKIMEQSSVAEMKQSSPQADLDELWRPITTEMTHRSLPDRRRNGRRR